MPTMGSPPLDIPMSSAPRLARIKYESMGMLVYNLSEMANGK
jgi:hypothetical protein